MSREVKKSKKSKLKKSVWLTAKSCVRKFYKLIYIVTKI